MTQHMDLLGPDGSKTCSEEVSLFTGDEVKVILVNRAFTQGRRCHVAL